MKLLAYEVDKRPFLGVFNENETWAYPISAAGMEYRSMKDLIREAGPSEMEMLDYISKKAPGDVNGAAPVEEIRIVSPIPEPDQDIICLGINYMDHAAESARFQKEEFARPEKAIYFSKRVNRTNDPDGIIPAHKNLTNQLDYEAELAVIIKKDAKDVKPEEVKDYIFGYTIMNDVSAREVQTEHKQWYHDGRFHCVSSGVKTPVKSKRRTPSGFQHRTFYPWNRRSDLRTYKRNDIKGRNDHRNRNAGRSRHGIRTAEIP